MNVYAAAGASRRTREIPTWAPTLFIIAFASEAGHMMLHVAQLIQYEIFHIYPKAGLLGPALVNNEWLHWGEVTGFWIMMVAVFIGYGKDGRAEWKARSLLGYRALIALLWVSGYHMIEHFARIIQYLETGHAPTPGILGHWINVAWLHAVLNTIEMTLVCIFAAKVHIDRDIPFLERQRAAMARAVGSLDFDRATDWLVRAGAICIAPLLVLFSDEMGPVPAPSATLTVQRLAVAHAGFSLSAYTGLLGGALLIPAAAGMLRLAGEHAKVVRVGAGLVFVGAIGLCAGMGLSLLAAEAGALSASGSKGAYVALAETVLKPHGYIVLLWVMTSMLAPGFVLLAVGLYARKAIPLWSAVCIGVGVIGQVWGHLDVDLVGFWFAGNLIWVVGMFPIGLGIVREVRRASATATVASGSIGVAAGTA